MGWWRRLLGREPGAEAAGLYDALVTRARTADWYAVAGVPDTLDGRFAVLASLMALTLNRLERDAAGIVASARLTERFVGDMDGQLRQIGIGDMLVGKHVGRMMSLLGGMTGAYRGAVDDGALREAVRRNLYPDATPTPEQVAHAAALLRAFADGLDAQPTDALLAGRLA